MNAPLRGLLLPLLVLLSGCATLGQVIQPPRFEVDGGRPAELRLTGPAPGRPLGGAALRIYARVQNPNPLAFTLSTLRGGLLLDGRQAAQVNFPLGIPLAAGAETIVPIDVGISFADVPGLADVITRTLTGGTVRYRLDGTVGVDAGVLGQPTFGPMTLLQGEVRPTR
ncbi:MAG: LEA type 2 family protein [Gemmatimonadota bacterium]|nr:LEA type 2 family protein [Gemmatimonadota bacterium]